MPAPFSYTVRSVASAIHPVGNSMHESESFTIPFYGDPLNSARGCVETAVTAAVVTENVRVSRR
jgi:hypothetical protein